jgi:flagellar protein FlbT
MALKISLKPRERMIIGGTVISNGNAKCDLIIENKVPILRQKDIMSEQEANSPCRRIYFVIQLMYIDEENLITHHNTYWDLVRGLVRAAPSVLGLIDQISEHIVNNRYYQALKLARRMIDFEQEVMNRVQKSAGSVSNY